MVSILSICIVADSIHYTYSSEKSTVVLENISTTTVYLPTFYLSIHLRLLSDGTQKENYVTTDEGHLECVRKHKIKNG